MASPGPGSGAALGPGFVLLVVAVALLAVQVHMRFLVMFDVLVFRVVLGMLRGRVCRADIHHQEQRGSNNFLHAKNVTRRSRWR